MTEQEQAIIDRIVSAGNIAPSNTVYEVVRAEGHKTLKVGDKVLMREAPGYDNIFVRVGDTSLHTLGSDAGYVLCLAEPRIGLGKGVPIKRL